MFAASWVGSGLCVYGAFASFTVVYPSSLGRDSTTEARPTDVVVESTCATSATTASLPFDVEHGADGAPLSGPESPSESGSHRAVDQSQLRDATPVDAVQMAAEARASRAVPAPVVPSTPDDDDDEDDGLHTDAPSPASATNASAPASATNASEPASAPAPAQSL